MTQKGRMRDDCPSEFVKALGELVVAAGQLEYSVALAIKRVLRKPLTEGLEVAEQMGGFGEQRKEIRKTFLRDFPKETQALSELDRLLNEISCVLEQRHRQMHSTAVYDESKVPRRLVSRKPHGARNQDIGYDVSSLGMLRDKTRELRDTLEAFTSKFYLSHR